MYIANGKFQKKPNRKWTWKNPEGSIKIEIDFIMTNRQDTILNLTVIKRVNTGSDHRLVRCRVNLWTQIERIKLVKPRKTKINCTQLKTEQNSFHLELRNRFAALEQKNHDINKCNQEIVSVVNDSALKVAKCMKTAISNKISEATKAMLKKRREMKQDKLKLETSNMLNCVRQ